MKIMNVMTMTSRHDLTSRRDWNLKESKSTRILKETKGMLINSKSYTRYLDDYQTKSQVSTFKSPTITLYPIYRPQASISLVLKQFQTSNLKYTSTKTPFPLISQKDKLKNKTERRTRMRNHSTVNLLQSVRSFRDHLLYELIPKYKLSLFVYDESVIFHNRHKYNKVIYDKLMLASVKPIENLTIEKKSVFNENTINEIILTINSMKIEFNNVTDKSKKPLRLDIPFSYLFLFYYKGFDYFKDLLLSLIRFTNSEFDSIVFNDQDIADLIKNSREDFTKLLDPPSDESKLFSTKPNEKVCLMFDKKVSFGGSSRSPFLNRKVLERKSSSYYSKLNTKAHFDVYNFIWSTPKYVYDVQIKLPSINVILTQSRKQITKGFEDDLFLFIFEKNFLDWDFYVISYLFSLKSFRLLMEATLSKKPHLRFQSEFSRRLSREFEKISISTAKTKTYSYLDDSAIFFYTNDSNENFINTLHSFSIKVDYDNLNPNKRFLFEFNFNQMKLLNKISQFESLERFIRKIVITEFDKGEMNIDYSMFNNFNENYFDGKTIRPEAGFGTVNSPDLNLLASDSTCREKVKKEMMIKIERPWIKRTEVKRAEMLIVESEKKFIPNDVLSELLFKEISQWSTTLLENSARITSRVFAERPGYERKNTSKGFRSSSTNSPVPKRKTAKPYHQNISLLKIS